MFYSACCASHTQEKKPFEPTVEHDTDQDTAKLFIQLLKLAGFEKDDKGNYTPIFPEAITRLLEMQGGFNALLRLGCFPARVIHNHEPSVLYNPMIASIGKIYSCAALELGKKAILGSDGKHKPEWLIRKLIANKWASTLATNPSDSQNKPDWRVQGLAAVMLKKKFVITTKNITSYVDGVPVAKRTLISATFTWQGRYRKKPGATHPRVLFPSL